MEKNNNPVPGMYKIKGFADDIAFKGSKSIERLTRMKIREKEKDYEIDKERRAKLKH